MASSAELTELLGRPVLEAAPLVLGAVLEHAGVAIRVTEVEAYDGDRDPGSHAYRGRTPRNATMFGPPGHLYVYFTYGMHHCCNLVCGESGRASALLVRAGEVVAGVETARRRRARGSDRDLARGPARLCQALAIDRSSNGTDLSVGPVLLHPAPPTPATLVRTGPRVGLRDGAALPWRFWMDAEPTVSTYRPAAPRRGNPL